MSAISDSDREPNSTDDAADPLFARLKKMVVAGHRARDKWRKEAVKAFDYVAGHQWSEDDRRILEEQGRPPITFNRTAPIIDAVCGLEVNNRQGVIFLPREMGDIGPNAVLSNAAKWVRDGCDAADEESEAFRNTAICGEGWTETRIEYDEDPQGQVVEECIDSLEMGVNEGARRANYKDARMIYRVRDIDAEDAKALFDKDYEPEAMHAKWMEDAITPADGGEGNKKDYPAKTRDGIGRDGRREKCRIVQVQWWDREQVYLVAQAGADEQGQPHALQTLSADDFKKYEARIAQMNVAAAEPVQYTHAQVPQKVFYEAFLGTGILAKRKIEMGMFQFRAMTGKRDRTDKCFYGMLRDMFDPQMWANKWLAQTLHIMNSTAKGGIMAETDAFVNQRKAEADWADSRKIIWAKPGAVSGGKVKERTPPPMPQALGDLMTFAISSIRDVTGVNLELLGQADREQAASLEMQRRQSAMTILATLFDALRRFRKSQGKLLLHFIQLLPDNTLIRIEEKGNYKYIPLVKDKNVNKYDVIIDEAPSSPNQKEAVWVFIKELLQSVPLPPQAVVKLLKFSPLPESAVQEVIEAMGMGEKMPPEVLQQKLDQAEQALQVLEEELKKAMETAKTAEDKREIEILKVQIEDYRAETERLKVLRDADNQEMAQASADQNANLDREQAAVEATSPKVPGEANPSTRVAGDNGIAELTGKVDQLAQMFSQFMQMAQGGAPSVPAQPEPEPQLQF